jgi:hypothetical protein
MDNHYRKLQLKTNERFGSSLDSWVYAALPENALFTKEVGFSLVAPNQSIPTSLGFREFCNVLDSLVETGFVREYNGIGLARCIESLPNQKKRVAA